MGLLTDQPRAGFGRIEGGYVLTSADGCFSVRRGFTVTSPLAGVPTRYGVEVVGVVGGNADLERCLHQEQAGPIDWRLDPLGGDLPRALVGDCEDLVAAGRLRRRLSLAGLKTRRILHRAASTTIAQVLELTDDEGEQHSFSTGSLLVVPAGATPLAIGGKPYRGGARLFINLRGLLNVINELDLEDYLRGVVPVELPPDVYDELEAQKAQALAARTYVLHRLGEFQLEGYDTLPTAECQVYGGMTVEHRLSDQAVADTAGLVITYRGATIDAMFTSTCGGATSDVSTMFPMRLDRPYLKRVPCVESDVIALEGRADSGLLSSLQTDARMFAAAANLDLDESAWLHDWNPQDLVTAVAAAGMLAGRATRGAPPPATTNRRDVIEYLGAELAVADAARSLVLAEDPTYFFPGSAPDDPASAVAAFLIKYRLLRTASLQPDYLATSMPRDEVHGLLWSYLKVVGAVREVSGRIASINGREIGVRLEGKRLRFELPPRTPVFRVLGDGAREAASAPIVLGDRATIVQRGGGPPLALVIEASREGAALDQASPYASWSRSWRADELVRTIKRQVSLVELHGLRVVESDASSRIHQLEVTAERGRTFVLTGIDVRFALAVPDNLFVFTKSTDLDGIDRYTFFGKGWGHGTGMCQVGAFGMAARGAQAEQIIRRYYQGVEIGRWP
ncbi:MAG: SpoIID/LytB domain-containing protein [Deltaproteobacteria bacterium]|nr:SpoIID/LytB domain-containing protein [Deltaproteobacteria bacterium]